MTCHLFRPADGMHPDAVALLGDEQYQVGKLSDFEQSFEQAWGGLRLLERPAPGNHEYYAYTKKGDNEAAQNGVGYFAYFNGHNQSGTPDTQGQAGDDTEARQGWYSYNLGNWHIISLNIECESAAFSNDCSTTDGGLLAQETQWLANDLASNHRACTIAYWHQPTFTAADTSTAVPNPSAPGADSVEGLASDAWWKLLDTLATEANGQFSNPNVVTAQDQAFGVMKLTLHPDSYSWDYKPALAGPGAGSTAMSYSDSGSAACRG